MPRPGRVIGGGLQWGGFGMARQFWLFCRRPAPSVEGRGLRAKIGAMMNSDERIERSRLLYERALFDGDGSALTAAERELDSVEADLALARGRLIHGRFLEERNDDSEQAREDPRELALFEQAVHLYQAIGDVRGEAEALFWVGCCHQVVRRDWGSRTTPPAAWRRLGGGWRSQLACAGRSASCPASPRIWSG